MNDNSWFNPSFSSPRIYLSNLFRIINNTLKLTREASNSMFHITEDKSDKGRWRHGRNYRWLLVEISSESTEEPPVFRMLRFFSIRGKKGRGGRSWKEGQETIVCKLFQCPAPSLGSLFHSDGEESRSTGELTERNLGRHLRDHWPTPEILQLVD